MDIFLDMGATAPIIYYVLIYFIVHCPTTDLQRRLGLLKQGVTIFTIT